MKDEDLLRRFQKALDVGGNLYAIEDIVAEVAAGTMQWLQSSNGAFHAVTTICNFPRRKVLLVVLGFGRMRDGAFEEVHDQIVALARSEGCAFIETGGRTGWARALSEKNWECIGAFRLRLE